VSSAALSLLCVRRLVIMADEKWIWIEVEGEDEAMLYLDVYHDVVRKRQRHLLEELAKDGVTFLAKNVPNYTSYTLRHVDRTDVGWKPGGAGGGGEYEVTIGIKAGTSYHPVYANRGTGIFGPYIKQPYTAYNPSGRMWFFSHIYGRVIGVREVKGQRAQHFLYTTYRELQVFALARMNLGAY
jgi:hypothetical protein